MNELFEILDELYGIEVQMESGIDILKDLEDLYMQKEAEICEETGEMMKTSEERKIAIFSRSYMESMRKSLRDAIERLDDASVGSLREEHKREYCQKEIPQKPTFDGDGYAPDGTAVWDEWICPCCGSRYEVDYDEYEYFILLRIKTKAGNGFCESFAWKEFEAMRK
mgnify:CR=1 FL=1|jgi:hypothetical protein